MALPTVGAKDLHVVQLDPKLRKILAARARRANQRQYAPILAADRGAFGAANREYHTEAQSVKGASNMLEGALSQALRGLQGSGLKGGALRQAQHELTARQGDAASAIPFLLADAGKERTKAISAARTQLVGDRAQMLSGSAQDFNQLLKEARGAGASKLKEEADKAESEHKAKVEEHKAASKELDLALADAKRLMVAYPEELPTTNEEWARFAAQVAKAEGVGLRAAMDAVKQIRIAKVPAQVNPFG